VCEFFALGFELFPRVDVVGQVRGDFDGGCTNLGAHLGEEAVRHVAVGAHGAHAAAAQVVRGLLVFGKNEFAHFVAGMTHGRVTGGVHETGEACPGRRAG
jgi:hypothetical protein